MSIFLLSQNVEEIYVAIINWHIFMYNKVLSDTTLYIIAQIFVAILEHRKITKS